uniref:Regulator of microtubule dynamics protein 1 n=1 Tax=Plectus sambesii TaxID=2011161 RepID=A0A914UU19_9BILA
MNFRHSLRTALRHFSFFVQRGQLQQQIRRFLPYIARHRRLVVGGTGGSAFAASMWGSRNEDAAKDSEKDIAEIIKRADVFYEQYLIDNVYAGLIRYEDSNNSELLWRLARATCEKAKLTQDKAKKKELIFKAFEVIEKAIANEPPEGSFGAHKWYAILLDYVGEYEGTKSRIRRSYDVRKHLERALEINQKDPTTWHILGVWHFAFADLPTYQRYIASAIFDTPPTSTYDDALYYFEKAETIQPDFYSKNLWYMAEVMQRKGELDKALIMYKRAFSLPIVSIDDKEVHEKCFKMLQKLGADVA